MTNWIELTRAIRGVSGTLVARVGRATTRRITMPVQRVSAGICLPVAIASVLSGLSPGPCAAQSAIGLRTQIENASHSGPVTFDLTNGQTVSGVFRGFVGDWADSVSAADRYATWRTTRPAWVPRTGDHLLTVQASGETIRGGFMGVGPTFLVLEAGDSRVGNRIEFAELTEAWADTGAGFAPCTGLRGRLLDAPGVVGVSLKVGAKLVVIPRESINSARGYGDANRSNGDPVVVYVVAAVAVVAVAALICASSAKSASNSAASSGSSGFADLTTCCNLIKMDSRSSPADRRFGASDVTHGVVDWAPGDTRRP